MNLDGTGLVRVTRGQALDGYPTWSPDSRQIAFHRRVMGHVQIFAVDAHGGKPRRLTELSPLSFSGFPNWGRVPQSPLAR